MASDALAVSASLKRPAPPTSTAVPASQPKVSKPKVDKLDGKMLEQHRRALGDEVKAVISVEKWCVAAKCHCETTCSLDVFMQLIVPEAVEVTPTTISVNTPVVVALLEGSESIGRVFGKSKITGGTRMGSWSADMMEVVFFPQTGAMRLWWTMR
jgi:hypothetical protein